MYCAIKTNTGLISIFFKNNILYNKMININEDGKCTVPLFKYTDNVVQQPQNISAEEQQKVADNWPSQLQNMFVISIKPPRLERFKRRIGPLQPYLTVIPGIDGSCLSKDELKKEGVYKPINELNELTRGQIGCFFSHRKAWKYIVDHKLPFGFILEDDCEITPNSETLMLCKLAFQQSENINWDIFFIGRNPALCKVRKKLRSNVVQVGKTWGLFAYVVTLKAARELLNKSQVIDDAVDCFVSTVKDAAKIKIGITPIPFTVVDEESDTVKD
jgi:glycosyl transferase family 25